MICNPRGGLLSHGCCKSWTWGWDSLFPSAMWWLIIFLPRLLFYIVRDKGIPSECPLFAIHDEACWVVDVANHGHEDVISLSHLQCGDYFSHSWDRNIRKFWRQEKCCPNLEGETSPFRNLWRYRMSTPNNLEKLRLVWVLDIFCTFLGKNEKNSQSSHWGRDSRIPSSCPRFATSTTRQASSWIAYLGHSDGIPSSLPQCGVRFYYSPTPFIFHNKPNFNTVLVVQSTMPWQRSLW